MLKVCSERDMFCLHGMLLSLLYDQGWILWSGQSTGEQPFSANALRSSRKLRNFYVPWDQITNEPSTYWNHQWGLQAALLSTPSLESSMKKLAVTSDSAPSLLPIPWPDSPPNPIHFLTLLASP